MPMLTEKNYDKATIHCDGHWSFVTYSDIPGRVFTTTGVELSGADLVRAQQFIQRTQEATRG
jgi:hypothetical protein